MVHHNYIIFSRISLYFLFKILFNYDVKEPSSLKNWLLEFASPYFEKDISIRIRLPGLKFRLCNFKQPLIIPVEDIAKLEMLKK